MLDVFKKTFLRTATCKQQADVLDPNGGIGFCKQEAKNLWITTFASGSIMAAGRSIFVTSQISTRLRRSRQQVSNPVSSIIHVTSFNVHVLKEQYWLHTIQCPIQPARLLDDITQDPAASYQGLSNL